MWNFFFGRRERRQARDLRFTVIAPEPRGQEETMALRENIDDLGAAAALQEVIEASRPRGDRTMTSQTTSIHIKTHVSAVSDDSEEYVRNIYTDTGRRPRRKEGVSPSCPLAAAPPAQATSSIVNDYVDVAIPNGKQSGEAPQSFRKNLIVDPVGTLLHATAAAALASGPPGRQYITPGPPPPDQRGRRARRSSEVRLLPITSGPLSPAHTPRRRAFSSSVHSGGPRIRARSRSARTL